MDECTTAIALFDQPNIKGTVLFQQFINSEQVLVRINLSNLAPRKIRAIHVHEFGDERKGCESLGSHWNPEDHNHGSIFVPNRERHAGDLINNIVPNDDGIFNYSYIDTKLNLIGDVKDTIIGRSVVVHEEEDDLGLGGLNQNGIVINKKVHEESLKTGNAGKRMACAIIGIAKSLN
jgi:Cu-Zn family superoxide dismutase